MSDEERRLSRRILSKEEMLGMLEARSERRLKYSTREFCEREEIWTVFANDNVIDGWYDECIKENIIPIWPNIVFIEQFPRTIEKKWRPVPIPVNDFIDEVIPEVIEAENLLAVFPSSSNDTCIFKPDEYIDALENEWKRYAKYQLADRSFQQLERDVTTRKDR